MNLPIRISRRAEADLTHQYRWYLDNAGLALAEQFLVAFDATMGRLSEHPGLGRTRRFRAPELAVIRSFPVQARFGVHLVFYRMIDDGLEVERVLHGARDLPRGLLEPSEDGPV